MNRVLVSRLARLLHLESVSGMMLQLLTAPSSDVSPY
jgi:hypothetical protein